MVGPDPGAARAATAGRSVVGPRPVPGIALRLVSRLLVAQAGATAAIGIGYGRRVMPWLTLTIIATVAVCGLAWLVRSGGQAPWLLAICVEACLAAVGLFSFAYAGYVGGTLLSLVTLGTLLHPAVAGAFAASPRGRRSAAEPAFLADVAVPADGTVLATGTVLANGGPDVLHDPVG